MSNQPEPILKFFNYSHLPEPYQGASKLCSDLAAQILVVAPRCAERTVALRKLLEAKDAFVRSLLPEDSGE